MTKFKPHKNCNCSHCKSGKFKKVTKPIERAFRRTVKQELNMKLADFENEVYPSGYYD